MYSRGLKSLAILSAVVLTGAYALVFFYAPNDADQGFVQKIFYVHVPMAIVALGGFVAGAWYGIRYLRTGDRTYDLKSYVAIHLSLMLAVAVLITGSIWARASWGHWWLWDEPMLVAFLIVFVLYGCYQPLRFSIEDPERQARYAAVFATIAGIFVPLNLGAVRMAEQTTHPKTLGTTTGGMPGEMMLCFVIALIGMTLLFVTLWRYELTAKHAAAQLRALRRRVADEADDPTPQPPRRSAAPQPLATSTPAE